MNVDEKQLKMIQELSDAPGPSGFEEEVLTVARRYAAPLGRIEEDFLRNLYIYRKENTGDKPILMLDAHADEVGFMIHSIKPNGCLRFVTLGGLEQEFPGVPEGTGAQCQRRIYSRYYCLQAGALYVCSREGKSQSGDFQYDH